MKEELKVGLTHTSELTVEKSHTAAAFGSGDIYVLATPMMVGLMENAARKAVEPALEEGSTTVGTHLDVAHLAATPLGMKVRAEATLIEIDGRKLTFKVLAYDEVEKIGEGTHTRFVINSEKFMKKNNEKIALRKN